MPMRIVRVDKFTEEQSTLEWLVDGLLPNVGWTLLYGTAGYGKTTFAMQLAASLQSGARFLGRPVKQTNVVYVQAVSVEEEWREILRRVAPKSKALTVVEVPERVFDDPRRVKGISKWIEKYQPGFVVFDSFYNLSGVDMNNAKALLPLNMIKAMLGKTPWLMVHHPRKEGDTYSGHNSIAGNCSNQWRLLKDKLVVEKGRLVNPNGKYGKDMFLAWWAIMVA